MGIRRANIKEWKAISDLLGQLDYLYTETFIKDNIERLITHPDEELLVYEDNERVIAFISMHYIPQIALLGDFARISYFSVDKTIRGKGIGNEIEEYCTELAKKRNCDRLEVHCHSRRIDAHRFYSRQGYTESPKSFIKMIK
ncbi:GNAT family N-acetyltransferase [Peribacillus frigoritolerans]|uniref:GNAT family N-acetyltransferase n=1 Tax=Peribacillus frigoritolerans TaxID=450367 RepID=UPI0024C04E12|nr:GNAT family N-acetyltransferase [Peribacillus frigoritolerans]WHY15317.1 GNAT family N-acetyltransferase [Peribacillus frigoritolerans]